MPRFQQGSIGIWRLAKEALNNSVLRYDEMPRDTEVDVDVSPLAETRGFAETAMRELLRFTETAGIPLRAGFRTLYFREHEIDGIRLWTGEQERDEIISNEEFEILRRVLGNLGYLFQEGGA